MRNRRAIPTSVLVAVALIMGACDGDGPGSGSRRNSTPVVIVGNYDCGSEGETPQDVLKVRKDGSVKLIWANGDAPDQAGTWELDGNSGTFHFSDHGQPFTAKDDRITFANEGGPREYVCTRAS